MAWIGAAIAGAAGIAGDVMSQQGQKATNAMNLAEIKQEEDWQTQMSNTAMQRRVDDLKLSGLNPMLAVGQGGASVPGVGTIAMQNPEQSMAQLGQQASSAVGLFQQQQMNDAQISKLRADTNKVKSTTIQPDIGPDGQPVQEKDGTYRYTLGQNTASYQQQADLGVTNAQRESLIAGVNNTNQDAAVKAAQVQLIKSQTNVTDLEEALHNLDLDQKRVLYPIFQQEAIRQLPANVTDSDYQVYLNTSPWGRILKDFGAAFGGAAQGISHLFPK